MNRKTKNLIKATLLWELFELLKLNSFKRRWIKKNYHNQTVPNNFFDMNTVDVGKYSYGELNIVSFDNKSRLTIGSFVSIAENVYFMLDVEHYTDHISTYPFRVKALNKCKSESFSKGNIAVGDDVWIGFGSIVMSGVSIGKGAIIAAGSVVTKDIPPYEIWGGAPAKHIKYRFAEPIRRKLLELDFSQIDKEVIESNVDLWYKTADDNCITILASELIKE